MFAKYTQRFGTNEQKRLKANCCSSLCDEIRARYAEATWLKLRDYTPEGSSAIKNIHLHEAKLSHAVKNLRKPVHSVSSHYCLNKMDLPKQMVNVGSIRRVLNIVQFGISLWQVLPLYQTWNRTLLKCGLLADELGSDWFTTWIWKQNVTPMNDFVFPQKVCLNKKWYKTFIIY